MSVDLIATAGDVNANSYVDLDTANRWLGERLYTEVWQAAEDDVKKTALIWATSFLERTMKWKGYKTSNTSRLQWPRSGVWKDEYTVWDGHVIPFTLEKATAELAFLLLKGERGNDPEIIGKGISQLSIAGVISITASAQFVDPFVPAYITNLLIGLGESQEIRVAGGRVVKLARG